jgi:hypothetical protein
MVTGHQDPRNRRKGARRYPMCHLTTGQRHHFIAATSARSGYDSAGTTHGSIGARHEEGGEGRGCSPPPLTFAQTSAKTLARCHRTIAEGHQVRAPHRFPVCAPHRRWIWPLALPDSATLRHPQAKSGCRRLHALLTDMKKRSPAATILAGPSGCVAELAPEAAWWREEGRGVAEGGRSIAACVTHSRGHGAGL